MAAGRSPRTFIHRTDAHLSKRLPGTGAWGDGSGLHVVTSQTDDPCGKLGAFYYDFGKAEGESGFEGDGKTIVLCSRLEKISALKSYRKPVMYGWGKGGDLRKATHGISEVASYLSHIVLHELMHAADATHCKSLRETESLRGLLGI